MEDYPLFVVPDVAITGMLSEEESHHVGRVLRMQIGEKLYVTDGAGSLYLAVLKGTDGKELPVELVEKVREVATPHPELHLAVAPLKNADRLEWLLEKLVEVGLASLSLVMTEHTIRKHNNMVRLQKVMLAAVKQSRKRMVTRINEYPGGIRDLCQSELPTQKFIAYCGDEYPKLELAKALRPGCSTVVLIGPEGDFSSEEVEMAVRYGFVPVALGTERLRSETAAVYAGMLHHIINTQAEK